MKILISGTSGGIGAAALAVARERGWQVVEVNRADYDDPCALDPRNFPHRDLDAVVFATGTCPIRPMVLTSDELFEDTMRVNCGYFLRLMRAVVSAKAYNPKGMKAIAVSSVSATEGWPGGAAYCASKGALSAMCRALSAELKGKRIEVEAVEPRYIRTKMFERGAGMMGVDAAEAQEPKDFARSLLDKLIN